MNISFSVDKLNKTELKAYEAMTPYEQASYAKTWTLLEEQKARLQQKVNASKERNAREKKQLMDRARKERTHRLIERGALVESFIPDPGSLSNEAFKDMLIEVFDASSTKYILQQYLGIQASTIGTPDAGISVDSDISQVLVEN